MIGFLSISFPFLPLDKAVASSESRYYSLRTLVVEIILLLPKTVFTSSPILLHCNSFQVFFPTRCRECVQFCFAPPIGGVFFALTPGEKNRAFATIGFFAKIWYNMSPIPNGCSFKCYFCRASIIRHLQLQQQPFNSRCCETNRASRPSNVRRVHFIRNTNICIRSSVVFHLNR